MELNPYASFLGDLDARAVLSSTPGLLHQAACAVTPEQADAPIAPGKWSVRQTVAHLADCELVFSFRLRQTLAEDYPVIQPFDQDRWARHYAGYDLPSGLELFRCAREWNIRLCAQLTAAELSRPLLHPERGTMTFLNVLETMAGHDLNHLGQVQRYVQQATA